MPLDAQYFLDGLYYKVGRFGWLFLWSGSEWIRSTRPVGEVTRKGEGVMVG